MMDSEEATPLNDEFRPSQGGFFQNYYLVLVALVICNSAFLFGYNSAVLNGPTSLVNNHTAIHFNSSSCENCQMLELKQIEVATGIALGGAMIGALGSNIPLDRFGRKWVLLGNNVFYIAGSAICATAVNYAMLLVGRFVVGVGFGVASVVVPQLLGEIAPKTIRGALTSMNQLAVTLGLLVTNLVWFGFQNVHNGWRYTIWFSLVPAALQLVLATLIPESPQWLVQRGRVADASNTLNRLRPRGWDVTSEVEEIEDALKLASRNQGSWKELFAFKRVVVIGIGSMAIQQLTGINAVMYYSSTIFGFAGVDNLSAATIGVMALNVGMTLFTLWLVDRLGRKPLLLGGLSLMIVSLVVAGLALIVLDASEKTQGLLAVIMVLLYVAGFAVGLGAVLWPILSEIFPNEIRSKGMSFCLALNWTFNLILSLSVLSIIDFFGGFYKSAAAGTQEKYGAGWVFIVFAVLSVLSLFFVYFLIPETKGKSLEEIQRMLKGERAHDKLGEFAR